MSPLAGRGTDCGIFKSKSALRLPQLSTPGRQRILPFPGGDCASAHAASVSISVDRSDGSFENFPTFGSANHGGMDSALSRGGWRWRMAESLRTFRRASGRCPGVTATLAMLLEDRQRIAIKARGIPQWELPAQTIRSAPKEGTRARRSEQETHEVLGWREYGMRIRCAASVCSGSLLPVYYFLPVASPTGAGKAEKLESTWSGREIRLYLRRVPISPIILSLSSDAGDSSDGWSKR